MTENNTTIRKSALAPTALVAGGAGFIGSHLVEALLVNGARVVVLDNFVTGKKTHLSSVLDNPKFSLIEWDINSGIPENIDAVDYVFHLAGQESYLYGDQKITLDSLLTNAIGTKNLLDLAKKSYAKFLLLSSVDIYDGLISSVDLDHYFGRTQLEENKFSHIEAKRFAEALVWEYHKKHKINARIARLCEVYGPRMDFTSGGELGRLTKQLLDHQDLVVYGDGLEKNYYVYISDVVSGIVKALFNDDTDGKIFTFSSDEPISTLELTYLVKGLSNTSTQVIFRNAASEKRKDAIVETNGGISDIKWSPKVDLKNGITKTLKWYSYQFNEKAFKPSKFLEKTDAKAESSISTLQGTVVGTQAVKTQAYEEAKQMPVMNRPALGIDQQPRDNNHTSFNLKALLAKLLPAKPSKDGSAFYNEPAARAKSESKNNQGITKKTPKQPQNPSNSNNSEVATPSKAQLKLLPASVILTLLFAFVGFALLPAGQTYYFARAGLNNLTESKEAISKLDLKNASTSSEKAVSNFSKAKGEFSKLGWVFVLTRQEKRLVTYAKALRIAEHTATAIKDASVGAEPFSNLWNNIKPNSKDPVNEQALAGSTLHFKDAREQLERALGEIKGLDSELLPDSQKALMDEFTNQAQSSIEALLIAEDAAGLIPKLIGIKDPKKYLILFQNQNELRATGGFIGSYAVLAMKEGKIAEITIDDIYNIDGLLDLGNYKEPAPAPIKEFGKQDFMRIRDANWDPSFIKSAQKVLDLYKEANGTTFDGVIAIDMTVVKDILEITGPVYLTAYNEEINSQNVYERTQYHSEASYTPGSQQKRAFLTVLGSKLLETIFSLSNEKVTPIAKVLMDNLDEKHILIALKNNEVARFVSEENWDGEIQDTKGDYIMVVDSNVGSNKANYFVRPEYKYEIKNNYRDGSIEGTLTLTYKHTGKDNAWPGGLYRNFLRVYLPKDVFLHKVTLFGGEVKAQQTISAQEQNSKQIIEKADLNQTPIDITKLIRQGTEYNKKLVELTLEVKPGETSEISLNYTLPANISLGKGEKIYNLYWQKQPGTEEIPALITFADPFGKDVVYSNPEFKKEGDMYKLNSNLKTDLKVFLQLR